MLPALLVLKTTSSILIKGSIILSLVTKHSVSTTNLLPPTIHCSLYGYRILKKLLKSSNMYIFTRYTHRLFKINFHCLMLGLTKLLRVIEIWRFAFLKIRRYVRINLRWTSSFTNSGVLGIRAFFGGVWPPRPVWAFALFMNTFIFNECVYVTSVTMPLYQGRKCTCFLGGDCCSHWAFKKKLGPLFETCETTFNLCSKII